MRKIGLSIIITSYLLMGCVNNDEFRDKRFYARMNPFSGQLSWVQLTPNSIIEDESYSYWYPDRDKVETKEKKCQLLENKIGYLKYYCSSENEHGEYKEVIIEEPSWFIGCSLIVKYTTKDKISAKYWIPDGTRNDEGYNHLNPFSYNNNNAYIDCPDKEAYLRNKRHEKERELYLKGK